jgi:glycosyltransferase involved in cell wall biosynthesis
MKHEPTKTKAPKGNTSDARVCPEDPLLLMYCPLPPPITGQSFASQDLLNYLRHQDLSTLLHINSSTSDRSIHSRLLRTIVEVPKYYMWSLKADIVYHQISQSTLGFLKDYVLTLPMRVFRAKQRRVFHLHGGGGYYFLKRKGIVSTMCQAMARMMFEKITYLVLLDPLGDENWLPYVKPTQISYVDNYTRREMANAQPKTIPTKQNTLRILFLSNIHADKGIFELIQATQILKQRGLDVSLDVAGGHTSAMVRRRFEEVLAGAPNVTYHGVVDGETKDRLLSNSDLFCLPTYYKSEGQPISILEAYAYGLPVITTYHNGIPHIFSDGINGIRCEAQNPESIASAIASLARNSNLYATASVQNITMARERFTKEKHLNKLSHLLFDKL